MQQTFSFVIETLLEIFIISAAVGRRYTLTVKNFPSTYCVLHKLGGTYSRISCEAHMTNDTIPDSHMKLYRSLGNCALRFYCTI